MLSIPLLLGKPLIFFLQSFKLRLLPHRVLVFEHAAHPCARNCLLRIITFLLFDAGVVFLVLGYLLVAPGTLLLGLVGDAFGVEEVFTFELGAAGSESGDILVWAIESLASSLHIC